MDWKKYLKILFHVEELFSCIAMILLTVVVIIQVFFQFISSTAIFSLEVMAPDWPEEVSLALMIYATYIGSSFVMRDRQHLSVTILAGLLPIKYVKYLNILIYLISTLFCFYIMYLGILKIGLLHALGQKTFALEIPVYWYYFCIPLGMGMTALRSIANLFGEWTGQMRKPPEDMEGLR